MRKFFIIFSILIISALLFAAYHYGYGQKEDALTSIEKVIERKEWVQAEKMLVDYLRIEMDMDKSWDAWLLLVDVSQKAQLHDAIILSYLNDMLKDYGKDAQKKKYILLQIARSKERQGNEAEAIEALVNYTHLPNLTPEEVFPAYEKLLAWYLIQGDFTAAEDVLHNCLSLPLSDQKMAFCLYTLAEIYAGKASYATAHELLHQLEMLDIDAYQLSQINFLHGDILEQQKKYSEALVFFKLALEEYGNRTVVEQRIAALEKRLKKK